MVEPSLWYLAGINRKQLGNFLFCDPNLMLKRKHFFNKLGVEERRKKIKNGLVVLKILQRSIF